MNTFGFNETSTKESFSTFNEKICAQAKNTPDKTVYIQLNETGQEITSISYKRLIYNSLCLSKQLLEQHQKGDRCLIAIPGGIEFLTAFLGCLFAGVIAVPTIIPKKNKANNRFWSIIHDSKPSCVLTTNEIKGLVESQLSLSPTAKDIKSILVVKTALNPDYSFDLPKVNRDDIAFLQYTSGSIDQPKGIMVSQGNLLHNSEIIKRSFNHTQDLVVVSWLPPFHDMGLIGCMLQPLYVGGSCVIIQPSAFIRNPALWFEAISKYKGTTVGCPNFALDYCAEKIIDSDVEKMDLSSLKVLFCGSEPVRENTLRNFSNKFKNLNFKPEMLLPCYGLAEATLMVSGISQHEEPLYCHVDWDKLENHTLIADPMEDNNFISYSSCGKTWNNTELIIVNPGTRAELSENLVGEVWVKNNSVCQGYWNKPLETNEVFYAYTANNEKGPFLRTGDLGFIKNNAVYITGRSKELIIIRGLNFFPNDIENIVDKSHPALQPNSCAVFSIKDKNKEKLVIVQEIKRVCIKDHNEDEVFKSIILAVSENFNIMVHAIAIINPMSLPKTSSGKIQRLECKNLYLENNLKTISSWENCENCNEDKIDNEGPLSAENIISWIKNWLSHKLSIDIEQIEADQPILSFGLDSIGAVELECAINETFDTDVFVGDFLENNSIKYLAEVGFNNRKITAL